MQYKNVLNWEDYRYVLAIARAGGVTMAVDELGVNVSTGFRRLEKIELAIRTQLFDRLRKGYVPTGAGRELIRAAEIMEQAAFAADRSVSGHDQQLVGDLRITATETLAACFLSRHIGAFRTQHPGLIVNVMSENRVMNLAERDADIALRPRRPNDETLVGRKIGTPRWGIYGCQQRVEGMSEIVDLDALSSSPFVVWSDNALALEAETWLLTKMPNVDIACRSNSLLTIAQMLANNVGLALLPCLTGATWPGLVPVLAPLEDIGSAYELWMVIHEDVRHNARVRALMEHLVKAAADDKPLFEGRRHPHR